MVKVRAAFQCVPGPRAIDEAFSALKAGNAALAWLHVNNRLHGLKEEGASVVDGACAIADALANDGMKKRVIDIFRELDPAGDGDVTKAEFCERMAALGFEDAIKELAAQGDNSLFGGNDKKGKNKLNKQKQKVCNRVLI